MLGLVRTPDHCGCRLNIGDLPRSKLSLSALTIALALAACSGEEGTPGSTTTTVDDNTNPTNAVTTTVADETATTADLPSSPTTTASSRSLSEELVFNPDFGLGDVTPTGWELVAEGSGQTVDYVVEAGDYHVSFFAPVVAEAPWPEARQVQEFPVTPHTDYVISVEARSVTQGRLYVAVGFRDADGNQILERGPGEPDVVSSDWVTLDGEIESPHDAATGYVILGLALRPEVTSADSIFVDVNSVSVRQILD